MAASGGAWRRLLRAAGVLLALLVALEGALHAAAYLLRDEARGAGSFLTDRHRVLFMGDSNTYGLYLERAQAYPMVFERFWNQRHPDRPIEVLNLGYPGTNSSRVLRELPHVIRSFRPDTIAVMVGANDYWTVPVAPDAEPSLRARLGEALWEWSRLYRLAFMLRRTLEAPAELAVTAKPGSNFEGGGATLEYGDRRVELGWQKRYDQAEVGEPEVSAELVRNLVAIAEAARAAGVRLLLLTYPAERDFYFHADLQLRRAASETSTTLVDLAQRFRASCPEGRCDLLYDDQHPTASGHELAARHLVEELGALDLL
jgi:lysophospholipase L1-like esterase